MRPAIERGGGAGAGDAGGEGAGMNAELWHARRVSEGRGSYPFLSTLTTRWKDNDVYGHVNNVEYYSYFDSVINRYLIREGGLDIHDGPVIGLCAESHCRFLRPLAFPRDVDAGLRVAHLGRSSVRYEIGLFGEGEESPAAEGWFVHVFVDRSTRRAHEIPPVVRAALGRLRVSADAGEAAEAAP
jgi:acyl-CoA thioester hydrolase